MAFRVTQAHSSEDWVQARMLIQEYAAALNVDLGFQHLSDELDHLRDHYGPPGGALLFVADDANPVEYLGGVGVRRFDAEAGEIKRLYVRPSGRGRGLGRVLANAIIARGQVLGYRRLVLDTLPSMREARALYVSLGFVPIAPYRFNPVAGTTFLELDIANHPGMS
jgi:GNAT superfamily N-acetyltransferase